WTRTASSSGALVWEQGSVQFGKEHVHELSETCIQFLALGIGQTLRVAGEAVLDIQLVQGGLAAKGQARDVRSMPGAVTRPGPVDLSVLLTDGGGLDEHGGLKFAFGFRTLLSKPLALFRTGHAIAGAQVTDVGRVERNRTGVTTAEKDHDLLTGGAIPIHTRKRARQLGACILLFIKRQILALPVSERTRHSAEPGGKAFEL